MKTHYSISELVNLSLELLPKTERGILKRATKEAWQFREVPAKGGKGGVKREYLPPPEVQAAILVHQKEHILAEAKLAPVPVLVETHSVSQQDPSYLVGSTEIQRQREGARLGVLTAIEKLMTETEASRDEAIITFLVSAQHPDRSHLAQMLRMANDKRGGGNDLPSKRTIQRWFKQRDEQGSLLPKVPQRNLSLPEWFKRFLVFYRSPQKPSVQAAFELFARAELAQQPLAKLPSVHQARRWLEKIGNVAREDGRLGKRELKSIKPYKVRDFSKLQPTDIYTADGHTFDAEVLHPDSGKPFRPEITTIVDVATRRIVGWSVDLAESGYAVLAAVCHAVKTGGIPAIFYVDNGGGYKNALMSDQATGLMGRLGITMTHSLPYGSQARGVIERLHQTVWVQAAKRLQSYIGADMDKQASQAVHKTSRQLMKQDIPLKGVPALSNILSLSPNLLPDFDEFRQIAAQAVDEYNNRPHRSLPKVMDISGSPRHMTPNELWALKIEQGASIHEVDEAESLYLFMPQEMRVVQRGQVTLRRNVYFNAALQEYNGDRLRVAFDMHNAERVWLFDDAGRYVCHADWNGNRIDYMPVSLIEQAKEKRVEGQIKRLGTKQSVLEAAKPNRTLEHQSSLNMGGLVLDMQNLQAQADLALAKMQPKAEVLPALKQQQTDECQAENEKQSNSNGFQVPDTREARYALYQTLQHQDDLPEAAAKWYARYGKTAECRYFEKQNQQVQYA